MWTHGHEPRRANNRTCLGYLSFEQGPAIARNRNNQANTFDLIRLLTAPPPSHPSPPHPSPRGVLAGRWTRRVICRYMVAVTTINVTLVSPTLYKIIDYTYMTVSATTVAVLTLFVPATMTGKTSQRLINYVTTLRFLAMKINISQLGGNYKPITNKRTSNGFACGCSQHFAFKTHSKILCSYLFCSFGRPVPCSICIYSAAGIPLKSLQCSGNPACPGCQLDCDWIK